MPDVFISYSSADVALARFVHAHLKQQGLDTFMAEISLRPGERWSESILANLRTSAWVILLASQEACASPFVQQEFGLALGDAIGGRKTIVPVVWDLDPAKLPGWMSRFQAIDLRTNLVNGIGPQLDAIAERIHAKKQEGALAIAAVMTGLILLAAQER